MGAVRRPGAPGLLTLLGAAFAIIAVLAWGAIKLAPDGSRVAPLWLANAVVVALLLRSGRSRWPALLGAAFLANCLANLALADPPRQAMLLASLNLIEVLVVAVPFRSRFDPQVGLADIGALGAFLPWAGLVGPGVAAAGAAAYLAPADAASAAELFGRWFIGNALGLLTLTPLLLSLPLRRDQFPTRRQVAEAGAILAFILLVTVAVFSQSASLLWAVFAPLMLAGLRLGVGGAALGTALVASLATLATLAGHGPIAAEPVGWAQQMLILQSFIATTLVILPVGAIIGERGPLGKALADQVRQFRRLAEASLDGVVQFDSAGRACFVNQCWTDMTGLTIDSTSGGGWLAMIAPADRAEAESLWHRAVATGSPVRGAVGFHAPGGEPRRGDLSFFPELDEAGAVIGYAGRLHDSTDWRAAEEALAESEALYRLVTENSQDMIMRLGLDGVPRYVSRASLRVLGYEPSELVGVPALYTIHPDDWSTFERIFTPLDGGLEHVARYRQRHKGGGYTWLEASYRQVADPDSGEALEVIASVRDINARRQTELVLADAAAKLRESNRLLTMAEELTLVGHWRFDARTGDFTYAEQFNRISGVPRRQTFDPASALALILPEDRRAVLEVLALARRGGSGCGCNVRLHRPDGELRHIHLMAQAEAQPDGKMTGLVGVVHDISQKVAEHEELIRARDEARAASAAKGQFLATMSHEIRTPMTGVLGMIDLLRGDPPADERERYLATLKQSAELLMTVLDDVLDYSKLESGAVSFEPSDFDIVALVASTLDLFAKAAERKGLALSLDCAKLEQSWVQGDSVRLQQVLSNLISNAIKFTDHGGVSVAISAVRLDPRRREWRIAVKDSGIGIAADDRDRLFQPFVQADVSTSRRFGGTGLGLAISRRLVDAMGGSIGVEANGAQGSSFWFRVPLEDSDAADQRIDTRSEAQAATRPLKVLVAEDNPVNQMLIGAILRQLGHSLSCVDNGRLAVEAAARGRFDCILMDMQMPEMDGLAATRAIRGSGGPCAPVPIIALTADASPERRRFYEGAGLTDFLTKPIDRQALAARLVRIAADDSGGGGERPPLLDPARLEELGEAIGSDRVGGLLELLAAELVDRPAAIRRSLLAGDAASARSEAHSLKGAAISVGAIALGQATERLEQAADPDAMSAALSLVEAEAERTRAAIAERRADSLQHQPGSRSGGGRESA